MARKGGGGKIPELVEGTVKKFMRKADVKTPHASGGPGAPGTAKAPHTSSPSVPSTLTTRINTHNQNRHTRGGDGYRGGGYVDSHADAQSVLDAVHSGDATVLGTTNRGHLLVRYDGVTGYNNNPKAGYLDQPTNVFIIKGTTNPSVVPTSPDGEARIVMTGNDAVLLVNQAFWGLFSDAINAVAVEQVGEDLVVHVALAHDSPAVREDLDDMADELEAFAMPAQPDIRVEATVSRGDPTWVGRRHRLVLLRKLD